MPALAVYIPISPGEKLKKTQVLKHFRDSIAPEIEKQAGKNPLQISLGWQSFVSGLQREGHITKRQAETWQNPYKQD